MTNHHITVAYVRSNPSLDRCELLNITTDTDTGSLEMSKPLFYIFDLKRLEPASEAHSWLGRIVKSYEAPGASFTPADPTPFTKDRVKKGTIKYVEQAVKASKNGTLRSTLTEIASLSLPSDKQTSFDFNTSSIVTVRLENYDKIFKQL